MARLLQNPPLLRALWARWQPTGLKKNIFRLLYALAVRHSSPHRPHHPVAAWQRGAYRGWLYMWVILRAVAPRLAFHLSERRGSLP